MSEEEIWKSVTGGVDKGARIRYHPRKRLLKKGFE